MEPLESKSGCARRSAPGFCILWGVFGAVVARNDPGLPEGRRPDLFGTPDGIRAHVL